MLAAAFTRKLTNFKMYVFLLITDEEGNERKLTSIQKRRQYAPTGVKSVAVNSEEYLASGADQIPVDEMFFYR